MRRGLIAGIIIGGIVGAYYGMNMGNREQRRLRHATDDVIDRGGDIVDQVKDRAVRLFDNLR